MLKRREETNKTFKCQNGTTVTLLKADHKSVVVEITSRACGQKTVMKLSKDQINKMINTVRDCSYSTMSVNTNTIENVLIKHRELTRRLDEATATYKYTDTNKGIIRIVHCGEQMIVAVGEDHEFVTISGNVYGANELINKLNYLIHEESMREWIR